VTDAPIDGVLSAALAAPDDVLDFDLGEGGVGQPSRWLTLRA
jgi:hypothetical protein